MLAVSRLDGTCLDWRPSARSKCAHAERFVPWLRLDLGELAVPGRPRQWGPANVQVRYLAIAGQDDHVAAVVGCPVACDITDGAVDSHQKTVLNGPV
jgi:hypothetical protein